MMTRLHLHWWQSPQGHVACLDCQRSQDQGSWSLQLPGCSHAAARALLKALHLCWSVTAVEVGLCLSCFPSLSYVMPHPSHTPQLSAGQ